MLRKTPQSDCDIASLAAELRRTWTRDAGLEPWLRRQLPRLQRLVHEGDFGWADIAKALNRAGIVDAEGTPWTARTLSVKRIQVRTQLRARKRRLGQLRVKTPDAEVEPPARVFFALGWWRTRLGLG
jgi:hypothetical protein